MRSEQASVSRAWRLPAAGLILLLVAATAAAAINDCYEDVRVSGAGSAEVNGTYTYDSRINGHPSYSAGPGGSKLIYYENSDGRWVIAVNGQDMYYRDCSCSLPKPTGWVVGPYGSAPAPRLDGGGLCTAALDITVEPAGAVSFLDRGWPEGEEPPLVGELVVSAVYEIGESISGCARMVDSNDQTVTGETINLAVFRVVRIGEDYDERVAIDVLLVRYNTDADGHCFSLPTADWLTGYYDLRLSFPDGSFEWIRVRLVEPPPEATP